jgi:tetratricopeptide (TPR) repeat protein
MSLRIDRGLFKYDFIDHHAVLGVTIDASIKDIRKRYLKIARRLHPDSSVLASELEKQLASELLSKLVNPAYEKLSAEQSRTEYMFILLQMGKRLLHESSTLELHSDLAKQLASKPNFNLLYKSAITKITETQFDILQQVPQIIAQISELNLIYLIRSTGESTPALPIGPQSNPPATIKVAVPPPPQEESIAEQYIRRAQILMDKNQFAQAKVELQDALKLEPKNSRCHSLIGLVYLRQNQLRVAKVHFDNALKLDPQNPAALEWKPKVDKALEKQSSKSQVKSSANNDSKQPNTSGGGLFRGLFGGKKK